MTNVLLTIEKAYTPACTYIAAQMQIMFLLFKFNQLQLLVWLSVSCFLWRMCVCLSASVFICCWYFAVTGNRVAVPTTDANTHRTLIEMRMFGFLPGDEKHCAEQRTLLPCPQSTEIPLKLRVHKMAVELNFAN